MKPKLVTLAALILTSLLMPANLFATASPEPPSDLISEKSGTEFLAFPHAYYKPETRLAGGFVMMTMFRQEEFPEELRPSTIASTFTYTQNNQFIWEFLPDFYLDRERFHLKGGITYKRKPDKFYGIGNDTTEDMEEDYSIDIIRINTDLQMETFSRFYVGLLYQYEWTHVTKFEKDGLLADSSLAGTGRGQASGLGLSFNFDTRNSALSSSRGILLKFSAVSFNQHLGSDYTFIRYTFDFRGFATVFKKHVLALQLYHNMIEGDAPFEMLPFLGGKDLLRGIFEGRFRDNAATICQAEYRSPIVGRFRVVGFAGFGQVVSTMSSYKADGFKFAYGGGLRFAVIKSDHVFLRADAARSRELTAFYVTISEAI